MQPSNDSAHTKWAPHRHFQKRIKNPTTELNIFPLNFISTEKIYNSNNHNNNNSNKNDNSKTIKNNNNNNENDNSNINNKNNYNKRRRRRRKRRRRKLQLNLTNKGRSAFPISYNLSRKVFLLTSEDIGSEITMESEFVSSY